ncbi:MAG TPA: hypothetical protein VFP50_15860 [Anaeromyxobacteraceae bacterium]|nr:hypothetical protein [Anaeromyxobacteraceae bacterium]
MRTLLLLLALAAPAAALADGELPGAEATVPADLPPPPAPPPSASPAPSAPSLPRLGLEVDLGVPDGAVVALVYRPVQVLRLSAGPAWNYLGFGLRVGATVAPFRWAVSPTLSADYGHFFDADARFIADRSSGVPAEVRPLLEKVSYDYLGGQLGLEIGSPRGLAFFLRGGIAYVWTTVRGTSQALRSSSSGQAVVSVSDPRLRATIPTLDLGVLYFF